MTVKTATNTRKPANKTRSIAKSARKSAKKAPGNSVAETSPAVVVDPQDVHSISSLGRLFDLDRATIRDRIEKAGIKAYSIKEKEKLFHLDEHLEMILRQDELAEAKLEKIRLEGERLAHDLAIKRGEYASVAEFTETVQKIFGRLHKKVVVQLPKRLSMRLHNANSAGELARLLETDLAKEFNDLRSDFKKFL